MAELQDRIHLRTTYYNYAKHLESTGNVSAAIVKWVELQLYPDFYNPRFSNQFSIPLDIYFSAILPLIFSNLPI